MIHSNKNKNRTLKFFSVLLTALLTLESSLSGTALAADSKTELQIGIAQEFETMNPLVMSMVASTYIFGFVGRTLVSLDANGKWYPQLAKTIPTIENGQAKFVTVDGKKTVQAVWEIKDNAKWGDGKPVICQDFKLAIQVAGSNNVSIPSKETYTQVTKIDFDPSNPKKCTFTYDKARWDFNQMPLTYPLPSHIEASIFEKYGSQKEGYEKNTAYTKSPQNPGLYNGPFVISEIKLGSHATLVANPNFYGKAPSLKKIIIKLIPNTSTLEANLRSGTIDMISSLGLAFDQALVLEKKTKEENLPFQVIFKPSLVYEHIDLNLENEFLKDVRVRKALLTSINRDDLVKALFQGKQQVAIHNFAPIDPWFTADKSKIVLYPYSKRDAEKLLESAGWKLEKDGYRYKDGKKLSLVFMTTAGNKTREVVQTYLKDQWKAVGIDIQIKNEPARVFFGETMNKRKFGAMAMYAWVSSPESSPRSNFHSSQIQSEKNGWSGQNNMAWSNPKVDTILDQIELEFDFKKRIGLAHQFLKYYTDEVPALPLYYRADNAVVKKNLKNFELPGHQFSETNFSENWVIE